MTRNIPQNTIMLTHDETQLLISLFASFDQLARSKGARVPLQARQLIGELASALGTKEAATSTEDEHLEYESITSSEAAEILGCTSRHVTALANDGRLEGRRVGDRWHLNRDSVICYRDYK